MFHLCATVFAALIYCLYEWSFFATKPSFLTGLAGSQQLLILLRSIALIGAPFLLIVLLTQLLSSISKSKAWWKLWNACAIAIPAFLFSSFLYIFISTFLSTILVGPMAIESPIRIVFFIAYLNLFLVSIQWLEQFRNAYWQERISRRLIAFSVCVFGTSCLALVAQYGFKQETSLRVPADSLGTPRSKPNILLISGDGIDADKTSIYDQTLQTTPFLKLFSKRMLVSSNAFSNANRTSGSLASVLTGRSPFTTRVLSDLDIVTGASVYQHLPGLLRSLGYISWQFTSLNQGNFWENNFKNSFNYVNLRSLDELPFSVPSHVKSTSTIPRTGNQLNIST